MRRPDVLLPELVNFKNRIVEYEKLLRSDRTGLETSNRLQRTLTVQWGKLRDEVLRRRVPLVITDSRGYPTWEFEDALRVQADPASFEMALRTLESAIRVVQAEIDFPPRFTDIAELRRIWFAVASVLLSVVVLGWLVRQSNAEVSESLESVLSVAGKLLPGRVVLTASVGLVAGLFLGLLVNQIHYQGWRGRKQVVYLVLALAFAIAAALVAKVG